MTQENKTYYDLNEAIKNYEYKKEGGKYYDVARQREIDTEQPEQHWIFVNYKERVFYTQSNYNPKENKIAEKEMIKIIRDEAEMIDRDKNFKIIC